MDACPPRPRLTRRQFSAVAVAAASAAATPAAARALARPRGVERWLIKGGVVLTGSKALGNFTRADVLVEGATIQAIAPDLKADAPLIDATGTIVIPGFIDGHRHPMPGAFKYGLPDYTGATQSQLMNSILHALRPQDIHAATLAEDLAAINSGFTTVADMAFISKSPEVVDAAIAAHLASGMRVVYCYGETRDDALLRFNPTATARTPTLPQFPQDIPRLRSTFFASEDQLLTLRMWVTAPEQYDQARQLGLGISHECYGLATPYRRLNAAPALRELAAQGKLGPDVTLIHATGMPIDVLKLLADAGGCITMAPMTDALTRGSANSVPPIQGVLDTGLIDRCGLSTDMSILESSEPFSQMRAILIVQRMLANMRWQAGDADAPATMEARQALTIGTSGGAAGVGLGGRVGVLEPKMQADIVMIRPGGVNMGLLSNAYGSVVMGASPAEVDTVMIRGRLRKRNGKLVDVDPAAVMRALDRSRAYLSEQIGVGSREDAVRSTMTIPLPKS